MRLVEGPDRRSPAPGRSAGLPEFTLAEYERTLDGLRGTPLLVDIWASSCGPCREEAPLLASAHETYDDRVRFVGVDILDERDSARAFMREVGWTYRSVYDPTRPRPDRAARHAVLRRVR
jgi:cytochrome c biogenesis protein CcmG/thiol:disulfide interchange protein DsbE